MLLQAFVGILSQDILKVILGIFLIVISILFLLRPVVKFPTNTSTVITGGGVSGLITGLLGNDEALRATFLTGFNCHRLFIHSFQYASNSYSILYSIRTRIVSAFGGIRCASTSKKEFFRIIL